MPGLALAALAALVPPPAKAVAVSARIDADGRSLLLPADYRALLNTYGPGVFDEDIAIFAPDPAKKAFNILWWTRQMAAAAQPSLEDPGGDGERTGFPYPRWPDAGSLLMWGQVREVHDLYWLTTGEPDDWPLVITRGRELLHERVDTSATEFLLALLTGQGTVPDFLPIYANDEHEFEPLVPPRS